MTKKNTTRKSDGAYSILYDVLLETKRFLQGAYSVYKQRVLLQSCE